MEELGKWERRKLEELLESQKVELARLGENHRELSSKFLQLERAFEINLQWQRRRELEFNLLRHESDGLKNKLIKQTEEEKTRIDTNLTEDIVEQRNYWQNAFLQQKKITERCKIEQDNFVESMKCECENILRETKKSAENQVHNLIDLYEAEKQKASGLEKALKGLEKEERERGERVLELANLLETLGRFDINVNSICHAAADALRNLTEHGSEFEEKLKGLRQLSWISKNKKKDFSVEALREQNSVLMEIVKSLKRKGNLQLKHRNVENDKMPWGARLAINGHNCNTGSSDNLRQRLNTTELREQAEKDERSTTALPHNAKTNIIMNETKSIMENIFYLESHLNGIFYKEYTIRFSDYHEMKIKHAPLMNKTARQLKLELINDEDQFQDSSLEKVVIFLKNIYTVIKMQRGINCGTQTKHVKLFNSSTQTQLTGNADKFLRLNTGAMMLNSEKRAIEKSLRNLERTVDELKSNALDQARSMVDKETKCPENDELFQCIELLSR